MFIFILSVSVIHNL